MSIWPDARQRVPGSDTLRLLGREPSGAWDGRDGFCFPLARVGKYLENGAEDSVWVFAQAIIARAREGA